MNQIARCDWLPERPRWSHLARSGLTAVSRKQNFTKSHIINPLLTKFVRSRWLDIGLVLFCEFMDLDFVSVHKHAKRELGQYPAILTEQTWSITHTYCYTPGFNECPSQFVHGVSPTSFYSVRCLGKGVGEDNTKLSFSF